MFYFIPVFIEIEPGTVIFDVAIFAGLFRLFTESCRGRLRMLQGRPVAHFALNVHEIGGIDFTDKPPRLVQSNDVANKAFGIKGLVDLSQGIISVSVPGMFPGLVNPGMTGFTYFFCCEHFFFLALALG